MSGSCTTINELCTYSSCLYMVPDPYSFCAALGASSSTCDVCQQLFMVELDSENNGQLHSDGIGINADSNKMVDFDDTLLISVGLIFLAMLILYIVVKSVKKSCVESNKSDDTSIKGNELQYNTFDENTVPI